ncbi:hypothetical protein JXA40_08995 [bacterium]|nr:hypothetical protein [candidate division CSSED10-310 bacterium]
MKRMMIGFGAIMVLFVMGVFASDTPADPEWIDITDEILGNPADAVGWMKDESGKVYRDAAGQNLKVVTSSLGTYLMDLKARKVFKINTDNTRIELEDMKLFQRDHGYSVVIRDSKVKIRMKLTEKVEGLKNIPGIKAFQ